MRGALLLFALWVLSIARAAEPPPLPQHGPAGVACAHCHEDVHRDGRECQTCHGTEAWTPLLFTVADHAATKFPLEGRHQRVDCAQCHVEHRLTGLPTQCAECHLDRHRGKLGSDCAQCHDPSGFAPVTRIVFDHAQRTGFALVGPHAGVECAACHQGDNGRAMRLVATATCATCHAAGHGDFGPDCASCHRPDLAAFTDAAFDHLAKTSFPLERRHSGLACAACHPTGSVASALTDRCQGCHVEPHGGQLGQVCGDCHEPDRWRLARFDHDSTSFPLRGRHFVAPCGSCHTGQRWVGLTKECWACHTQDLAAARVAYPQVRAHSELPDCGDCHTPWSFSL